MAILMVASEAGTICASSIKSASTQRARGYHTQQHQHDGVTAKIKSFKIGVADFDENTAENLMNTGPNLELVPTTENSHFP